MQVDELAAHVLAGPARLRGSRVVCIDGRAGAGKTSLAARLAAACAPTVQVTTIAMDDLYEGWSGLPTVADVVADQLLEPWAAGGPARLATWSWRARRRDEPVEVPLTGLVLLEGVGSWAQRYDDVVSTLVWVECDERTRRARARSRDGDLFDVYWDRWAADEVLVHERERTRVHAGVVVDTSDQPAVPLP